MNEQEKNQIIQSVLRSVKKEPDSIALSQAKALMERVELRAREMGIKVVIAVANAAGHPIAVHCMDDSYIASYDIALCKAYTAVALKMSTMELKELCQPGGSLYGIQNTNEGKIIIFGGGEPLRAGDKIIGGIGVSGGSEEQDRALAAYGSERCKEVLRWQ